MPSHLYTWPDPDTIVLHISYYRREDENFSARVVLLDLLHTFHHTRDLAGMAALRKGIINRIIAIILSQVINFTTILGM